MKSKTLSLLLGLALILGATVTSRADDQQTIRIPQGRGQGATWATPPVSQKYTCPMHPEVISGKPGKCPKCGMNLVLVKEPAAPKK